MTLNPNPLLYQVKKTFVYNGREYKKGELIETTGYYLKVHGESTIDFKNHRGLRDTMTATQFLYYFIQDMKVPQREEKKTLQHIKEHDYLTRNDKTK